MNKLLSSNKEPKNMATSVKNTASSVKNTIAEKISNVTEKAKETINAVKEKAQNVSGQIKNAVKPEEKPGGMFSSFESFTTKTNEFAESNTAITKFVFIIIMLLLFVLFFQLGSWLIQYFLGASKTPILLNGMVSANKLKKISVNPNDTDSIPIYRSINEDQGIEFTWNVWFFVDKLNTNNPSYSRIFSKGSENGSLALTIPTDCTDESCKSIFNS